MFKLFKKEPQLVAEKDTMLFAPASGSMVKMEDVKDPMFAQKMMGDGYAVFPSDGTITSPVRGEILTVFPTKHAIGIRSVAGDEIIVHVGIDSVALNGVPFKSYVKAGQKVDEGSKLVHMDITYLQEHGVDPTCIVVWTNADEGTSLELDYPQTVVAGGTVGRIAHE